MALRFKEIIPPKEAETALTTQYTAPEAAVQIHGFTAYNGGLAASSISVSIRGRVLVTKQIPAGGSYTFPELVGHIMTASADFATVASDPGINIALSGVEITE